MQNESTLAEAAASLATHLRSQSSAYCHTVGHSDAEIVVYKHRKVGPEIPKDWRGWPVKRRWLGRVKAYVGALD